MSVKVTDRIVYPSRATYADALDALEAALGYIPEGADIFLKALNYYGDRKGIDFPVLGSHSGNEANLWRDERFARTKDGFGIAVYGDGSPGASFASYDDAAFFAVSEYCLKLGIPLTSDEVDRARSINATKHDRVVRLIARGGFPDVDRIEQMNTKFGDNDCWWMCDENGPAAIVQKAKILFPSLPDQTDQTDQTDQPTNPGNGGTVADLNMTPGLIPLPAMERHIVDVSKRCQGDGRGYDNLGARRIDALYVHRSQGSWSGNISHFDSHCPGALTDIQIDHVTGKAMRFVDLAAPGAFRDAPSGWANGSVSNPIGDAAKLIAKHGGNASAVNRFAESCEVTGFFGPNGDDPVSPAAKRTIAQWMASRAHDYGIPWSDFPMIADEGRSFIIGHRESRGGKADDCPGDLIWSLIATNDAELIAMARAIMKSAQTKGIDTPTTTTTQPPTPPKPEYADRITTGLTGKDTTIKRKVTIKTGEKDAKGKAITEQIDVVFDVFEMERPFEVVFKTKRRQGPDSRQPIVGPPLEVRETFGSRYYAVPRKQAGKKIPTTQYVLTEIATWVQANHLSPRISIRKA